MGGSPEALPGVLARAEADGVRRFVVVGFDLPSSERALALARADPRVFAVVGVHPHDARAYSPAAEARLSMAAFPRLPEVLRSVRQLSRRIDDLARRLEQEGR